MNMRKALALVLGALLPVTSGCSLAAPGSQTITIMPSEPNADVYVDGNKIGTGTQAVSLSKRSTHSVMVKCGDSAGTGTIERHLSGTGVADIIGGLIILVPFVGLAAPGAYALSPDTLTVAVPDGSGCQPQDQQASAM